MPRVIHVCEICGNLKAIEIGKCRIVSAGDLRAPRMKSGLLSELVYSYRGLRVGHVVFEARAVNLVIPGSLSVVPFPCAMTHTVQAPQAGFLHGLCRAGEHASFARGQAFGR